MVKDTDIRPVLLEFLNVRHASERDSLIIEEFGLCQGDARVDVAVVNGSLNGYEIKSESDTLNRLPRQQDIYNKIFDSVTLVISKKHLKKAVKAIPKWWGLSEAKIDNREMMIQEVRPPGINKDSDSSYLVQLLWRDEALEALKERGLHKGVMSKPRDILWNRLIECLSFDELKAEIRKRIKIRQNWRSDQ